LAISFRVKITEWNSDAMLKVMNQRMRAGAQTVGQQVSGRAKNLVSRPNPGGVNPSAPGEPPKLVTGQLRNSIDYRVDTSANSVTVTVQAAAPYAGYLEFGTVKMAARPFLRPAFEESKGSILRILVGG